MEKEQTGNAKKRGGGKKKEKRLGQKTSPKRFYKKGWTPGKKTLIDGQDGAALGPSEKKELRNPGGGGPRGKQHVLLEKRKDGESTLKLMWKRRGRNENGKTKKY